MSEFNVLNQHFSKSKMHQIMLNRDWIELYNDNPTDSREQVKTMMLSFLTIFCSNLLKAKSS